MSKWLRWGIMIASFIILVYGGMLFGMKYLNLALPVFNCPYNLEVGIKGSCLYITEWSDNIVNGISFKSILLPFGIYTATIIGVIFFGKLWCGFVCPFGFVQEVLYKIRSWIGIKPFLIKDKYKTYIKITKYGVLALFLIGIDFCELCPVRYVLPPLAGVATRLEIGLIVAVIIMTASFFSERFFCRICPMGAIIGLLNKITPWKIKKNCTSCTECGICYEACPMDIEEIFKERKKENVTNADCIMCGKCIDNCPENDALSLTLFSKKIYCSSRKKYYGNN